MPERIARPHTAIIGIRECTPPGTARGPEALPLELDEAPVGAAELGEPPALAVGGDETVTRTLALAWGMELKRIEAAIARHIAHERASRSAGCGAPEAPKNTRNGNRNRIE